MKQRKDKQIPAATIRGTYSTYENSKQRDINYRLGHVVDLVLEKLAMIECGMWCSGLRVTALPGTRVTITSKPDGSTRILISANNKGEK
jgi:hypothetical protein